MSLRSKLQLGIALMLMLTVGTGAVAIWAVQSWQSATSELVSAHAQGLAAQRLVGDLYRQIKEVLDRLVSDDQEARDRERGPPVPNAETRHSLPT